MFDSTLVCQKFVDKGFKANQIQTHMASLLAEILNSLDSENEHQERILYLYAGSRKGNTELWRAFKESYPEHIHVVSYTLEMSKHFGFEDSIKTIQKRDDLKDKIVIIDAGGALYLQSRATGLTPGQANTFVNDKKLRALVFS